MNSNQREAVQSIIKANEAQLKREKHSRQNAVFATMIELMRRERAEQAFQDAYREERRKSAYQAIRQAILGGRR